MDQPVIKIEFPQPELAILSLNRPQKRNALNLDLLRAFCAEMENLTQMTALRAIIVKGNGPVFCAGMDLNEAIDLEIEEESALWISHGLRAIYQCPLVTIAAIHGAALGGGAGLAAAFDIVIACEDTFIGFPEVRRGLVPAQIAPFLRRQLGWHALRELLLLGELINAKRAMDLGLINAITTKDTLIEEAIKMAKLVIKGAPKAIAMTKQLLKALDIPSIDEELMKVMPYHHEARHSEEAKKGIEAFKNKQELMW